MAVISSNIRSSRTCVLPITRFMSLISCCWMDTWNMVHLLFLLSGLLIRVSLFLVLYMAAIQYFFIIYNHLNCHLSHTGFYDIFEQQCIASFQISALKSGTIQVISWILNFPQGRCFNSYRYFKQLINRRDP